MDTLGVLRPSLRATVAVVLLIAAADASAQTVTLSVPVTQVTDCTIRGGTYANIVDNSGTLVTRASGTLTYVRRALVKFDTSTTIPAGTAIQSATLTLVLKSAGSTTSGTRTVTAVPITNSFIDTQATWNIRKSGYAWTRAGGDLGAAMAQATVGVTPGQRVSFNVTTYVQAVINGRYGSRYSRIGVIDVGSSTSASYREYYASESVDASVRPVLTVVLGSTPPPPPPPTTSTASVRVLHWNIHHGVGTDGVYNLDRLATWMATMSPDVVSLNESERYDSWGNEDQPKRFQALLQQKTGRTWYVHFAQRYGNWTGNGQGNTLLSVFPFASEANDALPYRRSQGLGIVVINGRNVVISNTHLDDASSSYRTAEINALKPWTAGFPDDRLVMGDFNAQPTTSEIATLMTPDYLDAWAVAYAGGTAISYPGNPYGNTRNTRIDYVFLSKRSTNLWIAAAQVYDTRDANGIKPSDHNPLVVTVGIR